MTWFPVLGYHNDVPCNRASRPRSGTHLPCPVLKMCYITGGGSDYVTSGSYRKWSCPWQEDVCQLCVPSSGRLEVVLPLPGTHQYSAKGKYGGVGVMCVPNSRGPFWHSYVCRATRVSLLCCMSPKCSQTRLLISLIVFFQCILYHSDTLRLGPRVYCQPLRVLQGQIHPLWSYPIFPLFICGGMMHHPWFVSHCRLWGLLLFSP